MIKRILLIASTVIINSVYGINLLHLKKNKIYHYFDALTGDIKEISNVCKNKMDTLSIDEVPLFLKDFYWKGEPTYIFCEDKQVGKNLSSPVRESLSSSGKKCIYITLQNEGKSLHTITCIFPQWPGLANVSKRAAYDNNRGIMLFPLIPSNPQWYYDVKNINIYTDFWKELNSFIISQFYDEIVFNAGVSGHLCIALPCLVNYYKGVLSFFCPMRDATFSLDLCFNKVSFSNELFIETDLRRYSLIMDIWSPKVTQVRSVEVQSF